MQYWQINRKSKQRNVIESPEIYPNIYGNFIYNILVISSQKGIFLTTSKQITLCMGFKTHVKTGDKRENIFILFRATFLQ